MTSLTGGELNYLNGQYGISAPSNSVPVMRLIKAHRPKSKEELVKLIKEHSQAECECGVISKGTIEDFGRNLYNSQLEEWGEYRYTLEECIQWEYNLFVVQSLKGDLMEDKAKTSLLEELIGFTVEEANSFYDEHSRIDLVVKKDHKVIAGIQVKPSSFMCTRDGVQYMNKKLNSTAGFPVFYLYYDYDKEKFCNLTEVIAGFT